MAIIHPSTLTPTKLDLLEAWLPARAWYPADEANGLERVGAYRFDDPAGAVGVESLLVRAGGGPLTHVPLTYRDAPLAGAEHWLVGTTEHSVLGRRWVYDAIGDPVYLATLVATVRTGGREADEMVETGSGPQRRESATSVRGSGHAAPGAPAGALVRVEDGDPAILVTDQVRVSVRRVLAGLPAELAGLPAESTGLPAGETLTLTGTWPGQDTPVLLAAVQ
jgi:hypothetical protein